MKTISQVAAITGVSARALQYYDEIGLLKPSRLTPAGYRLYDDEALKRLRQILFYKELGFKLRDIQDLLRQPGLQQAAAFKKQRELLVLKRDRLNKLISLLGRLEKGEQGMSFEEFDMSEYIAALEQFKLQNADEVTKHWGSVEEFEQYIERVKKDEPKLAQIAIQQYGSVEKYTQAMKHNLAHFSELMEQAGKIRENQEEILQKSNDLYASLVSDLSRDPASAEVQAVVGQIVALARQTSMGMDMGEGYWDMVAASYSRDPVRGITDQKYGDGAADFTAEALKRYFHP